MKFKVGDRVKIISKCRDCNYWFSARNQACVNIFFNRIGVIIKKYSEGWDMWNVKINERNTCHFHEDQLKLEEPMSKYEDLKGRIKALENGWDKEADEVLEELKRESDLYIVIRQAGDGSGKISIGDYTLKDSKWESAIWNKGDQCEKMEIFKEALLRLLDYIKKDEKQDKIEELEAKMEEFRRQIEELKKK